MLVRYLTNDPPDRGELSARVIDGEDDLLITDVVIAETAYVLTSVYHMPRQAIVDRIIDVLQKTNIDTFRIEKALVLDALLRCRPSGRVSFPDALIWAAARSAGAPIFSLDERFPSDGVTVLRSARSDSA